MTCDAATNVIRSVVDYAERAKLLDRRCEICAGVDQGDVELGRDEFCEPIERFAIDQLPGRRRRARQHVYLARQRIGKHHVAVDDDPVHFRSPTRCPLHHSPPYVAHRTHRSPL